MGIYDEEKIEKINKEVDENLGKSAKKKKVDFETRNKKIDRPVEKDISYDETKKRINTKTPLDKNRALMFLSVFGMLVIIVFYQMLSEVSAGLAVIMLFLGMVAFMPIGLILGKFLLDPYTRCKIMRKMRGKNYGMIYFVYKGGQRVDIKIKNLDNDVIVRKDETKIWVLEEGSIYYVDRDDNVILHSVIKGHNVVTSPQDVPLVFLDPETMLPLRFYKPTTRTNPQQAGATLLGYVNNQIAKNLFFKKSQQIFFLLMIVMSFCNLAGLVMLYDALVGL